MRLTGACLLLCLLAPMLSAQQDVADKAEAKFKRLYLDAALEVGDYDTHAANLVKLIQAEPGNPLALYALRRYMNLERELATLRPMYNLLLKYSGDDFKACSYRPHEFAAAYVRLARRFEQSLEWQNVARRWDGIKLAAVVGPFADGTAGIHDDAFAPEMMLDFSAEYEGAYGRIRWQQAKHHKPLDSTLDLFNQDRWAGYGYYVAMQLASDAERECGLTFKFNGPSKAWLNGQPIYDADSRRRVIPDEFTVNVKLNRGRNILLVKQSTISSLRVWLRDAKGFPVKGVVATVPNEKSPRIRIAGASTALHPIPDEFQLAENHITQAQQRKRPALEALSNLIAAEAFDHYGLSIRATSAAEEAERLLPTEPLVQLAFIEWISKGPLHSSSARRKLTRAITDKLLKDNPNLVPAVFAKAELLTDDERYREAVELLTGVLPHTPAKWRVHLELAKVFRDASWQPERERAIKAALKLAPTALPVLRAASDYFASIGAQDREIAMDLARLDQAPGDPDAHLSLANTLARTAENAESLKHLRALLAADPANEFMMGRLAEALAANGNVTDALKVYEQLAAWDSRPEEALYKAARACLQLGRQEQGVAYLERVVANDPGHHIARRELQRIRGQSEDVWSKYAVSWEEMLKHDLTREQFPRADSAMILDEQIQIVYPDGSSVSYVHQVRKILTQEGVDNRGKDQISGELVTARTVQADGTVLEPITQPGGLIEFPGVKIGAYLDIAFLVRGDGGPMRSLDSDAFYFVDHLLSEPFAITRWVLVTPTEMQLNVIYHGLNADDEGVSITAEPKGDNTVRIWDVRNPRLPEVEAFMPTPLELIPWIECVQPRDWRDRARKLADEGLREIMDTPLIRKKAAELCKDLKTDEDKARKIYAWVNATFTTEGDAWNAHQALKSGAGERQELFISLCAASGMRLGFAYADAAPPYKSAPEESMTRPHWAYPNRDDFGEFYVVVIGNDGADIYVDLTERLRPFGDYPARRFNAPAVLWREGVNNRPADFELTFMPGGDRAKDRFVNKVEIVLAEDGSAKLAGSITVHGERSYGLKEAMRTTPNDELCNELEATLAEQYKGFEVSECIFPKIGEVGEPLVQEYVGSVRQFADVGKDELTLDMPGEKLGRLMSVLVGAQKRESDIVLNFDLVQTDEVRIKAPEGYSFSSVPNDLVYPTAPLTYELKFRIEGNELVITRKLLLGPGRFQPSEYGDLVEQVKRIKQAEESTLKLVKN